MQASEKWPSHRGTTGAAPLVWAVGSRESEEEIGRNFLYFCFDAGARGLRSKVEIGETFYIGLRRFAEPPTVSRQLSAKIKRCLAVRDKTQWALSRLEETPLYELPHTKKNRTPLRIPFRVDFWYNVLLCAGIKTFRIGDMILRHNDGICKIYPKGGHKGLDSFPYFFVPICPPLCLRPLEMTSIPKKDSTLVHWMHAQFPCLRSCACCKNQSPFSFSAVRTGQPIECK